MKYRITAKIDVQVDNVNNIVVPAGTSLTAYDNIAYYNGAAFDWCQYRNDFKAEGMTTGAGIEADDLSAAPGKTYIGKNLYRQVTVSSEGGYDASLANASLQFGSKQGNQIESMIVTGCSEDTINSLVSMFKNSGFPNAAYDLSSGMILMELPAGSE